MSHRPAITATIIALDEAENLGELLPIRVGRLLTCRLLLPRCGVPRRHKSGILTSWDEKVKPSQRMNVDTLNV